MGCGERCQFWGKIGRKEAGKMGCGAGWDAGQYGMWGKMGVGIRVIFFSFILCSSSKFNRHGLSNFGKQYY
jgi:hypothetical protein